MQVLNNEHDIFFYNLKYSGVDLTEYYILAGKLMAENLIRDFPNKKNISIVTGLGGNSADGLAIGLELSKHKDLNLKVYVVGRINKFENPASKLIFDKLKETQVIIKTDIYANDIETSEIFVEALVGTGIEGTKLNKRFKDVVKKFTTFKSIRIAVDVPTPHYNPDKVYSLQYPKVTNAEVIPINFPTDFYSIFGPGEYESLMKPNSFTHLSKNGKVLVFSDEDIKVENDENFAVEVNTYSFLSISNSKFSQDSLKEYVETSRVLVFGDIKDSLISYSTLKYILENLKKTFIFFGNSIHLYNSTINLQGLNNTLFLVDHTNVGGLVDIKSEGGVLSSLKKFSLENNCIIMYLGVNTYLINTGTEVISLQIGNVFTKDFIQKLAVYIASYSTENSIWVSLKSAFWRLV